VAPGAQHTRDASAPRDGDRSAGAEGERRSSRRRRLRWLVAAALVVVVAAVLAVVWLGSGSGGYHGAETGVPAGDTTASVTRRTLSESSTVDGTLGYGTTLELYDRLAGTFTWLPPVGAVIGRGGTLWRIDDLPIVLMYGSVPAYRALKQGVSEGPDVTELNENLIDLGFDPYGAITELEEFGEATAAAVRRWQKAEGLPESGEVELGRVVFAPGARRVTALHVALGQDPPGASDAPAATTPASGTETPTTPAAKKPPHKKKPKKPARKTPAPKQPAAKQPSAEGAEEPSAGAGMVVLSTTSTRQLVQLKVKAEQQELAHVGERAPVTLPDGDVVAGRISAVGTVAESPAADDPSGEKGASDEAGEAATIAVTLALDHHVARLDEAPVSVELVKSVRKNVLVVPATALTATAGGGYAIEVLEGDRRVSLAVTPGMFADGYVQVEGRGLRDGLTVIESE
jgi:multidrug efflux system membrane fusion protein